MFDTLRGTEAEFVNNNIAQKFTNMFSPILFRILNGILLSRKLLQILNAIIIIGMTTYTEIL